MVDTNPPILADTKTLRAGLILLAVLPARAGPVTRSEFGVLLCNHVVAEVGVLGVRCFELLVESGFVGGNLLLSEGLNSLNGSLKLRVCGNLLLGVWLLSQVTRVADFAGTKCALSLLEVRIRMLADFALIVLHHVNWFVTSHS